MNITKITVKRFRGLKGPTEPIDFSPGLNIIKGNDNEAGKSSLRMAIIKALFQDPNTTRKDIQALTSWGTDEPWEIILEFEADETSYRITKSLKDKTGELSAIGHDEFVARNKETITEKIAELTGCPTEAFYESTACIGQEEFIRIVPESTKNTRENPLGTITGRLQARLSGTEGTDIPALLTMLYAKTHRKDADGPYSHLQSITDRLADLRDQKAGQETRVNDIIEKREVFAQAKLELEKIGRELPPKMDLLEKNRMILGLQKDISRDKTQYDSLQKAKQLKAEIDRLGKDLAPDVRFENAEEDIKKLADARERVDTLAGQSTIYREDVDKTEKQKPSLSTLVAGIILIIGGLIGLLANPFLWAISVAGLIPAAYWVISRRLWITQRKEAMLKLSNLEADLAKARDEENRLLGEFGCNSFDEFQTRLDGFRRKSNAKREAVNGLQIITDGREWPKYIEDNIELDVQMTAKLNEMHNLESAKLAPLPLQELEREVSDLQKHKYELEQESGALDKFFQYTNTDRDQYIEIEEEMTELEQQRVFWEKKKKIYEITHDIMEQAHKQTLSRAIDLLEMEINRDIALITDGRYNRVKIKEEANSLSIQTFSVEMNDWVSVDHLSRAAQDQFYICARLALAKLITEGKRPVILLDDPFVNFHARRLKKTMNLLQDISKEGYQILLFTCSDDYDYLGKVIMVDS